MRKLIQGALIGGLILWFWSFFFWAISGIPLQGMKAFKDPDQVERVLRENAAEPGYYVLPVAHVPEGPSGQAAVEARMKKVNEDFFASGAVRVGGLGSMGKQMGGSVAGNLLAAALVTLLLLQTSGLSFGRRWLFVMTVALTAWVVGHWPASVWWGVTYDWTGLLLLDTVAGWALAGLALAKITGD